MGSGPESIESRERMVADALGEDTFPSGKAEKEGTGQQDSLGVTGSQGPLPFRKTKA